jgi:hypothetical protein
MLRIKTILRVFSGSVGIITCDIMWEQGREVNNKRA